MIFPIGDDQVIRGHKPYLSYAFIGINVLIFLYQVTLSTPASNEFVMTYGSVPSQILAGDNHYSLFTNMFLHGGWMHLIGNMMFLWVFADNIEATIGNFKFLLFYLLGGLAASAAHIFFNMQSTIPAIGASGAISAVLGAYMVMFPRSKIKVFVIYIFNSFKMAAIWFLGLWIAQQFASMFMALPTQSAQTSGVAWWAHIGGFAFGVVAGLLFKYVFHMPRLDGEVDPGVV